MLRMCHSLEISEFACPLFLSFFLIWLFISSAWQRWSGCSLDLWERLWYCTTLKPFTMKQLKKLLKRIPIIGPLIMALYSKLPGHRFRSSEKYWIQRYQKGGNSGAGSYNRLAEFKAEIVNRFVEEHQIQSVMEFGAGDGNQLTLARYPRYIGFDVSEQALQICRRRFAGDESKAFKLVSQYNGESSELTLSLDVIYHLVEDEVFADYMTRLFAASQRFVIIYSSDTDQQGRAQPSHVRHRRFSQWIDANLPEWELIGNVPNKFPLEGDENTGSWADFYIYEKGVGNSDVHP